MNTAHHRFHHHDRFIIIIALSSSMLHHRFNIAQHRSASLHRRFLHPISSAVSLVGSWTMARSSFVCHSLAPLQLVGGLDPRLTLDGIIFASRLCVLSYCPWMVFSWRSDPFSVSHPAAHSCRRLDLHSNSPTRCLQFLVLLVPGPFLSSVRSPSVANDLFLCSRLSRLQGLTPSA